MMNKKSVAPALRKSELNRLKREWRTAVRDAIKRVPCPDDAADILACFDAALDEIQTGRKIVAVLAVA
jgi:hypothetical protein